MFFMPKKIRPRISCWLCRELDGAAWLGKKVTETSLLSAFQAVEDQRHEIEGY
jgi:hypothetical protein